jgi:hypothetical protein
MHSAVFRSLTSSDTQVAIFRDKHTVSNGTQLLVLPKSQNRLSVDGRTLVGSRNPMTKSLNLEAINYRVLTVGEEKRVCQWIVPRQHKKQYPNSVEIREFASSLRKERTHCDIESVACATAHPPASAAPREGLWVSIIGNIVDIS